MTSAIPVQKKAIRFHARSFVAFTLAPEAPLRDWLKGLDRWTENSPGFFTGRPVVLDLNALPLPLGEIAGLVAQLAARGIRVYAIEANGIDTVGPALPPLLRGARATPIEESRRLDDTGREAASSPAPAPSNSLIIKSPISSGQSVFHPDGDVIVLGSTGSGSEIIAAGSIHVYGTLRGRAFAGAAGNADARIFCRKNEAELLAIDGWYRTADEMDASSRGKPVQTFLENGTIYVAALD